MYPISYDDKSEKNVDTGSHDELDKWRTISYPFDKYHIKIKLDSQDKFIGVEEISVDKEFISNKQKFLDYYEDASKYYED